MKAHDPLNPRAQEQQRASQEADRKLAMEQEATDFQWLMADARGRRFVWRLLEQTGVFRSSFTGNSETFFREGARNVGLRVLDNIHTHAPEAYVQMLEEQKTQ